MVAGILEGAAATGLEIALDRQSFRRNNVVPRQSEIIASDRIDLNLSDGRAAASIATKLGNHSLHAADITAYLKNGVMLEKAAQMANHASTHTTQLYD